MDARRSLLDDPWLAPHEGAIRGRAESSEALAARLAGGGKLSDWARAHEHYGLHRTPSGWSFREWAPNATAIWLTGDFTKWRRETRFRLKRNAATGDWEREFPAKLIRHGQHYRLDVEWEGGSGERIPAYARRVVQDSETNLFSAQVWDPPEKREWLNGKPRRPKTLRIYEAHVGMSGEEPRVSTYAEFRDSVLPRIKKAGYNTVQLMAVMEHPYYGSFGYHVSSFFAPSSRFGTPEELKSLVDAAHGMGLLVVMDLVHSHAVKNERDGLSLFDGTPYQYFHDGGRGWHSAWDSRCFDYSKPEVMRFLLSNCRYWLEEFRFDGFRFDGVTSMLYLNHGLGDAFTNYSQYFCGNVDDDAWRYLSLANRVVHEVDAKAVTIAEDVSGMPGCAAARKDCGMGFDYRMAMGVPDFWFRMAEEVRDEDWSVGAIYHALTDKRAEEKVVSYVESHDQALVGGKTFFFQLVDAAVYTGMRADQHSLEIERGIALHKMARLATMSLSGGAYLNFMGNEFGHPEWIDFPREENGWSYAHARRQWSLRDDRSLRFAALGDFDAAAVRLGCEGEPVLLCANEADKVLAYWRGGRVWVFNFNPSQSFADYPVMVPPGAAGYALELDTDETRFGGQGRIAPRQIFAPRSEMRGNEMIETVRLYLPARTAIVLKRAGKGGADAKQRRKRK